MQPSKAEDPYGPQESPARMHRLRRGVAVVASLVLFAAILTDGRSVHGASYTSVRVVASRSPGSSSAAGRRAGEGVFGLLSLAEEPSVRDDLPPGPPLGPGVIAAPSNLGGDLGDTYYRLPDDPQPHGLYIWWQNTPPPERCGSSRLVGVVYTVAVRERQIHPGSGLVVGDLNAPGHLSHRKGVDVDVFGTNEFVIANGQNADRAVELAKLFVDTGVIDVIFYNDPAVQAAVNAYAGRDLMRPWPLHDDHFHVRIHGDHELPERISC